MINPLIVIPARLGSLRIHQKPLALLSHEAMVVKVWRLAIQAKIGTVVVACDHEMVANAITQHGGRIVITSPFTRTGSDRVWEVLNAIDQDKKHDVVVNLQGDMPLFPPSILKDVLEPMHQRPETDISTIIQSAEKAPLHSVKVRAEAIPGTPWFQCLDFSRTTIHSSYAHVGVYAFRRKAIDNFSALSQTNNEKRESLEQLRALDHGMSIVGIKAQDTDSFITVDTPEDLEKAVHFFSAKARGQSI